MRRFLRANPLSLFLTCGGLFLAGAAPVPAASAETAQDEQLLRKAHVTADGPGVLEFFRRRTLPDDYPKQVEHLIRRLGDDSAKVRNQARKDLIALGPPALPALRLALKNPEDVVQDLARQCIHVLEKDPGPALPLAALHVLRDRNPAGACPVLLGYLPFADNNDVAEETLEVLVTVGSKGGKTDPALVAALKDQNAVRRGGAAYAVGRLGNLDERAAVRELLGDAEARVRTWAGAGIVGKEIYESARKSASADDKLLKGQKVKPDEKGLLDFFRKRTLSKADQERLREWVRQLGSNAYKERHKASAELMKFGSAALPYLRTALKDPDVEIKARAAKCVAAIESGLGTALPAAAARLLVLRVPDKAVRTLLAYAPFADDEMVEEEVRNALAVLNLRRVAVDAALTAAAKDQAPTRRAAAAFVLGRVGTRRDLRLVRSLLGDADAAVRFEAAHALLAAREKAAVPVLVALLEEGPVELARKAEELLAGVRGDAATKVELTEKPADRRKVRRAWADWWQTSADKVDMSKISLDSRLARETRARKVTMQFLNSLLALNFPAVKKTMSFPFYMEGMRGPNGMNVANSAADIEPFFKMIEGEAARIKEQFKQLRFRIKNVSPLETFLKQPLDKNRGFMAQMRQNEDRFLKRFHKRDILIVTIEVLMQGRPQGGGGGAVFVKVAAGRASVVGLGQAREEVMKK